MKRIDMRLLVWYRRFLLSLVCLFFLYRITSAQGAKNSTDYALKAQLFVNQAQFDSAIFYYSRVYDESVHSKNSKAEIEALINLGLCYKFISDFDRSLNYYSRALQLCGEDGDPDMKASILNHSASVLEIQGEYDRALVYYDSALSLTLINKNDSLRAAILSNKGILYDSKELFEEALTNHYDALHLREALGDSLSIMRSYVNIAWVQSRLGNHKEGERIVEYAINFFKRQGNARVLVYCYVALTHCLTGQRKFDEAVQKYKLAMDLVKLFHGKYEFTLIYSGLYRIAMEQQDPEKALYYFKMEQAYRDTLRSDSARLFQTRFEFAKREELLQKEKELTQLKQQQQSRILFWVSVSLFIALFAVAGIAYGIYKRRKMVEQTNVLLLEKNRVIEENKNVLEAMHATLKRYHESNNTLASEEAQLKSTKDVYVRTCETLARNLGVSRVSIWMFTDERDAIVRNCLVAGDGTSDEKVLLKRTDFPMYFNAIESKPFVVAADAARHAETAEFKEGYLSPLRIFSMLDAAIVLNGVTVGVVCCENQDGVREWTAEDSLYVQSVTNFVSLYLNNRQIKDLLEEVRQRNNELVAQSNEIEAMNEELAAMNEEMKSLNEGLELAVVERTRELELQNKQLTEYAFMNSHVLRAPLARILGLANIISMEVTDVSDKRLINSLIIASHELDVIIRQISDILYDSDNSKREDVRMILENALNQLQGNSDR